MFNLTKACLSIAAVTLISIPTVQTEEFNNRESICGGRRYELRTVLNGASPYVKLSADGISGQFLLDYGATTSSLSASAFALSNGALANLSLPGFTGRSFELKRYDKPLQPPGSQIGVIGADLLLNLTVELTGNAVFLGEQPCQSDALRTRGLIPIAQKGFFSSDPSTIHGHPNVPVVFLRLGELRTWAQIDTGYDDVVYGHSVDINQAFFEQLIKSKIEFEHVADIRIYTCEGHETRQVYTVNNLSLVIETDQGAPLVRTETFHLILKPPNSCGGIAAMTEPAGQLGASFLRTFGTVVFDSKTETVWMESDQKGQKQH